MIDAFVAFWYWIPIWIASFFSPWWMPRTYQVLRARKKKPALTAVEKKYKWSGDVAGQNVGKELALPEQPVKTYESWDHPAPPILVLSASLPSAPIGYGWEIVVVSNEAGNPALRLAMLDLATATVVDAIEADLVILRRWKYAADDTYADFYRRAEAQARAEVTGWRNYGDSLRGGWRQPIYDKDPNELMGKVMMANLITPVVDWARLITLRYIVDHPDETKCNYVLIESTEGVNA
jgi:hypothetical protein